MTNATVHILEGKVLLRQSRVALADDCCCDQTVPTFYACCLDDGSCIETDLPDCSALGGVFHAGKNCQQVECEFGACCRLGESPACTVETPDNCDALGGTFMGHGTVCEDADCPGACCHANGDCSISTKPACDAIDGVFRGKGVLCADVDCDGACCPSAGDCYITGPGACNDAGGVWMGFNKTCVDVSCAPSGHACLRCGDCCCFSEDATMFFNIVLGSCTDANCNQECGSASGSTTNLVGNGCLQGCDGCTSYFDSCDPPSHHTTANVEVLCSSGIPWFGASVCSWGILAPEDCGADCCGGTCTVTGPGGAGCDDGFATFTVANNFCCDDNGVCVEGRGGCGSPNLCT